MQLKKVPMRMCTGCGAMKPKKELVRIVHNSLGEISVDRTGKKPGRGAYICGNPDCLHKVRKTKRLEKAFGCGIPDVVFAQLETEICVDGG